MKGDSDDTSAETEQLAQLREQAEQLTEQVGRLAGTVGAGVAGLKRRTGRHSKVLWLLGGSFAFDVIITVALAVTGAEVVRNANDLEDVQNVTSTEVLCPLYDVFLDSEKIPQIKQSGETGAEFDQRIEAREEAFKTIHRGYDALHCAEQG